MYKSASRLHKNKRSSYLEVVWAIFLLLIGSNRAIDMFFGFVLWGIACSAVLALPQPQYASPPPGPVPQYNQYTTPIPILAQSFELDPDGSYHYGYQTGNGISSEERGAIKNRGSADEINSVQGYYTYPGLDGVQYTVTYTADENGFVPQGAHLPTPPPIPTEILRALERLPKENTEYDERGFPVRPVQGFINRA